MRPVLSGAARIAWQGSVPNSSTTFRVVLNPFGGNLLTVERDQFDALGQSVWREVSRETEAWLMAIACALQDLSQRPKPNGN